MSHLTDAARLRSAEKLAVYLARGDDPDDIDDETGESALAVVAETGDMDLVEMLLLAGADPDSPSSVLPPLHAAAGAGHVDVVEQLMLAGADIDAEDEDGVTALGSAAAGGHANIVEMLMEAGADPAHKDRGGNVPAVYAIDNAHSGVAEMLLEFSPPSVRQRLRIQNEFHQQSVPAEAVESFLNAARVGKKTEIASILKGGMPVDAIAMTGMTALMMAANKGHLPIVQYLVKCGADANRRDEYGTSAMAFAAMTGQGKVYTFLRNITAKALVIEAERYKKVTCDRGQWKE